MCFSAQVGVKAPGTATRTTFFSLNSTKRMSVSLESKISEHWTRRLHTFAGVVLDGQAAAVEAGLVGGVRDVEEADVLGEGLAGERCHFECLVCLVR